MKNNLVKVIFRIIGILILPFYTCAQSVPINPTNRLYSNYKLPPNSKIQKEEIIKFLKNWIKPNTPFRNKFILDILRNASFEEMYSQRRGVSLDSRLLIVPLKQSYFSQHVNKAGSMPFQNLIVDIDKNDKIFTIDVSLIYPFNTQIKSLPMNNFDCYYAQYKPIDGIYALISIINGDSKYFEADIRDNERVQTRAWRRQKFSNNLYEWTLETTNITYNNDVSKSKVETKVQKLGTTNTSSPPMFKGDLIQKENL